MDKKDFDKLKAGDKIWFYDYDKKIYCCQEIKHFFIGNITYAYTEKTSVPIDGAFLTKKEAVKGKLSYDIQDERNNIKNYQEHISSYIQIIKNMREQILKSRNVIKKLKKKL